MLSLRVDSDCLGGFVQQAGLAITHPLRLAVPSLIIFSAFAGLQIVRYN